MKYGYIRVSSDKQTVENQKFEINNWCAAKDWEIDGWIEETISGTKSPDKRKIGKLLDTIKEGDILICSELSRLGRNLFMVMDILSTCMEKGVQVFTIKDHYELSNKMESKILAFAFGLAAEIERDMISQRTKEALALRAAQGIKLGRPKGSLSKNTKLGPYEESIRILIAEKDNTYSEVARLFKVDRSTLKNFCDNRGIKRPFNSIAKKEDELIIKMK